jgi:hypothetical protein
MVVVAAAAAVGAVVVLAMPAGLGLDMLGRGRAVWQHSDNHRPSTTTSVSVYN